MSILRPVAHVAPADLSALCDAIVEVRAMVGAGGAAQVDEELDDEI